ncbi:16255_t:CDS:2, partial [Acaulospora morrowiae]
MNDYERQRLENIESNKRILRELGLERPPQPIQPFNNVLRKTKRKIATKKIRRIEISNLPRANIEGSSFTGGLRRSRRIKNQPISYREDSCLGDDDDKAATGVYVRDPRWREKRPDPKNFGHIPGIEVGAWWATRMECCHAGVHAPTVAGIAFIETEGAISVALSGGYEDDVDWGEAFTYTGSGGRDLKGTRANPKNLRTAPQSKDQELSGGNLALKLSCENGKPVRVIRGYKLANQYAPKEGYRYDGLYKVERWWEETGLAGFKVYKYAFKRLPDQPPLGTCIHSFSESEEDDEEIVDNDEEN